VRCEAQHEPAHSHVLLGASSAIKGRIARDWALPPQVSHKADGIAETLNCSGCAKTGGDLLAHRVRLALG